MDCFYSIIIPTYNAASVLSRAIESVLHQSFTNWELLIMDGLSTDDTLRIAEKYKDERIKIFSEKDKGVYDAMNKGVQFATGEWIYFLGSDDYIFNNDVLKKASERIISFFSLNQNFDLVYGNVNSPEYGEKYDGEFNISKILKKNICHQSIFYNKNIFEKKGKHNLKYRILADYEFNLRCFLDKTINTKYIDLTIAHYSAGGLSDKIIDEALVQDKNLIIKNNGYKSLSLKTLKSYCDSNIDFLQFVAKRILG